MANNCILLQYTNSSAGVAVYEMSLKCLMDNVKTARRQVKNIFNFKMTLSMARTDQSSLIHVNMYPYK